MRSVLLYTLLRVAAFLATAAVLLSLNGLLSLDLPALVVLAVAVLVSAAVSWWALRRQREAVAASLASLDQ